MLKLALLTWGSRIELTRAPILGRSTNQSADPGQINQSKAGDLPTLGWVDIEFRLNVNLIILPWFSVLFQAQHTCEPFKEKFKNIIKFKTFAEKFVVLNKIGFYNNICPC